MKLTYVLPFFNNEPAVIQQIESWRRLDKKYSGQMELILIDDCSSHSSIPSLPSNIRMFRIENPILWNQGGARNLGVVFSRADWVVLSDVDYIISPESFSFILDNLKNLDVSTLYLATTSDSSGQPLSVHPNTFLLFKPYYFAIGGVDEDYCGNYGYEDLRFIDLWVANIGPLALLNEFKIRHNGFHTSLTRDTSKNKELHAIKSKLKLVDKKMLRFSFHELTLS